MSKLIYLTPEFSYIAFNESFFLLSKELSSRMKKKLLQKRLVEKLAYKKLGVKKVT